MAISPSKEPVSFSRASARVTASEGTNKTTAIRPGTMLYRDFSEGLYHTRLLMSTPVSASLNCTCCAENICVLAFSPAIPCWADTASIPSTTSCTSAAPAREPCTASPKPRGMTMAMSTVPASSRSSAAW